MSELSEFEQLRESDVEFANQVGALRGRMQDMGIQRVGDRDAKLRAARDSIFSAESDFQAWLRNAKENPGG